MESKCPAGQIVRWSPGRPIHEAKVKGRAHVGRLGSESSGIHRVENIVARSARERDVHVAERDWPRTRTRQFKLRQRILDRAGENEAYYRTIRASKAYELRVTSTASQAGVVDARQICCALKSKSNEFFTIAGSLALKSKRSPRK